MRCVLQLKGKANVCFDLLEKYFEIRSHEDTTEIRYLDFSILNNVKTETSHTRRVKLFSEEQSLAETFDECSQHVFSPSLVYSQVLANLSMILVVIMNYGGVLQGWSSCVLGRGSNGRHGGCHWVTTFFTLV